MKRYRGWMILLIVAVTGCAAQTQSASTALRYPNDAAAIRAVFDTTTQGWNRGELPVYLSAYTESATAMGSQGPERGVNAIGDRDAGRLLENRASVTGASLRAFGDPSARSGQRAGDGPICSQRRRPAGSNWLVHNDLDSHPGRLAHDPRPLVLIDGLTGWEHMIIMYAHARFSHYVPTNGIR